MNLTDQQQRIIATQQNAVVRGRPGSGKTTVALLKAVEHLKKPGFPDFAKILFLSFSRTAIRQIFGGVTERVPRELRRRVEVMTLHSFCFHALRSHSPLGGLPSPISLLTPEEERITKAKLKDDSDIFFIEMEKLRGQVRFDRLATIVRSLFMRHRPLLEAYARAYPLIIVDEYQDTDDVQDELLRLFADLTQVVCLGDPAQRIYDFRPGTSPRRLKDLEEKYGFEPIRLERVNHRSGDSGILEYARAILAGDSERLARPACVTVLNAGRQRTSIVKQVCIAILQIRKALRNPRAKIAVMARTNEFVCDLSRGLLNPPGKFKSFHHSVILDAEEISAAWGVVLRILECDDYPVSFGAVLTAIADSERCKRTGGNQARIRSLTEWASEMRDSGNIRKGCFGERLRGLLRELRNEYRGDAERDLECLLTRISELPGDYLSRCIDLMELRCAQASTRDLLNGLAELYAISGGYRGALELGRGQLAREWLEEARFENPRLSLMTFHRCKGREFDGVVAVESASPGERFVERTEEGLAKHPKSRRLMHTVVSRARSRVVIVTPAYDRSKLMGLV